jgi:CHASE2 domain-containing sensor protein
MNRKTKVSIYTALSSITLYGLWILCSWFFTWAIPWKWVDMLLTLAVFPVLFYVWYKLYMKYFKIEEK